MNIVDKAQLNTPGDALGPKHKILRSVKIGNLIVLLTGAFYVGNGWVAGGCWDDDITSDEMDHSRKFPAKHQ